MELYELNEELSTQLRSQIKGNGLNNLPVYRLGEPMDYTCVLSCARDSSKNIYGQTLIGADETYQARRVLRASNQELGDIIIEAYGTPLNPDLVPQRFNDSTSIKRLACKKLDNLILESLPEDSWKILQGKEGVHYREDIIEPEQEISA